jgi:integrase
MREYGSKLTGDVEGFLRKRLVSCLDRLPLQEVSPPKLEDLLQSQSEELSAKSLNELRGAVHTIFKRATQRGLWHGPNPAAAVERRKVARKLFDTLRAEEVPLLLASLSSTWRPLFAAAIWTGMRKGELLGLKKTDVDLVQGTIAVRRSYDHESTKGNHADLVPIAAQLRPYLAEAMLGSRSQYVFAAEDGSLRSRDTKLQSVLRCALARAGLVMGYRQVCRRKGCGHLEETRDRSARHCPKCRMKLWPKAIQRPLRFHDLRGTTAALLARSGVGLVVAQRILRHSDPRLTANIYSRVDLADLQAGIDRLGIPPAAQG